MTALPTRKLEAWRYTDLRPLSSSDFSPPAPVQAALPDMDIPRLVFLNGAFSAEYSSPVPFLEAFAPVLEES